jgi:Fe-S oxidoreductase
MMIIMSDLSVVAWAMRVTDYGDYYIIDFFDDKFIVRKKSVERDLVKILRHIPCHYQRAFLRILSLRVGFNVNEIVRSITCK